MPLARDLKALAAAAVLAAAAGCARHPDGAAQHYPQVLRYGNFAEPQDLDPQVVQGVPEFHIMTALFDGLLEPNPKTLDPQPGLASSWDVSEDGLTYTFHLRPGIKWSDGSPITTDDFLLSWKRMISPKIASEYAYLFYQFVRGAKDYYDGKTDDFSKVGLSAPDDHTLVVKLVGPTPFLTKIIAHHYAWDPLPTKVLRKFGALDVRSTPWTRAGNLVASGPFKLREWTPNVRIVVERNPEYWDAAHVTLDQVVFLPTEDIPAEERMFRADQLDRTQEVPQDKIPAYHSEHPELLHIDPYLGVYFYRCNVTRPPLNDKRVRRALAIALDRERLIRDVVKGGNRPAYAVSYPGNTGYSPRAQITGTLADAKRLLAEAGFPDGRGMPPIQLLYNTSANNKITAEAIQEMWRTKLGVDIELLNQEWKVYLDSQHTHNYQMERAGWIADYPDPHVFLEIFETGNGNNDTLWSNPEYDRLLHEARQARDQASRYEIYQKMDAILVDECPVIPIYYYTRVYLMKPRVRGYTPNLMDNPFFKTIHIQN